MVPRRINQLKQQYNLCLKVYTRLWLQVKCSWTIYWLNKSIWCHKSWHITGWTKFLRYKRQTYGYNSYLTHWQHFWCYSVHEWDIIHVTKTSVGTYKTHTVIQYPLLHVLTGWPCEIHNIKIELYLYMYTTCSGPISGHHQACQLPLRPCSMTKIRVWGIYIHILTQLWKWYPWNTSHASWVNLSGCVSLYSH
jgi:hypothetical protein